MRPNTTLFRRDDAESDRIDEYPRTGTAARLFGGFSLDRDVSFCLVASALRRRGSRSTRRVSQITVGRPQRAVSENENRVSTARLRLLPPWSSAIRGKQKQRTTAAILGRQHRVQWVSRVTDPDVSPMGRVALATSRDCGRLVGLAERRRAAHRRQPRLSRRRRGEPAPDFTLVFSPEARTLGPGDDAEGMPQFPGVLKATATGVLEVVIDAAGSVESARLVQSVHPRYDLLLLGAAKKWQYQPAQLDGTAVRYTKRIQITLAPPPTEASRR